MLGPSGGDTIETHVHYAPTQNLQKADLIVYADDKAAPVQPTRNTADSNSA